VASLGCLPLHSRKRRSRDGSGFRPKRRPRRARGTLHLGADQHFPRVSVSARSPGRLPNCPHARRPRRGKLRHHTGRSRKIVPPPQPWAKCGAPGDRLFFPNPNPRCDSKIVKGLDIKSRLRPASGVRTTLPRKRGFPGLVSSMLGIPGSLIPSLAARGTTAATIQTPRRGRSGSGGLRRRFAPGSPRLGPV
jgi:hypothetical protein